MFDTGIARIYTLATTTENGGMPVETLTKNFDCFYGQRTISSKRYYEAEAANKQIDSIVRVPFDVEIEVGMYFADIDNITTQYRIEAVAPVIIKSNTRAQELTLVKLEENYDISTE